MSKYYFTNYKNKKILVLDFSSLSGKSILKLLSESKSFICKQPENSMLCLINITNMKYNSDTLNAFKKYVEDNEIYVFASAIFGASFLQAMAIKTFSKSNSMLLKIYETEREALDWLASLQL